MKDVNPVLSYAHRKRVPQYKKNGSYDAKCVARVAINELNTLPDAMLEDMYWTLSQLVNRRANLKTHYIRLKNQLHEQVCIAYSSHKQFSTRKCQEILDAVKADGDTTRGYQPEG